MRQITLDDVGQELPESYHVSIFYRNHLRYTSNVYPAMVIKAPNGQHLAVTYRVGKLARLTMRQKKGIQMFMRRNRQSE